MIFKNAQVFTFTKSFALTANELSEHINTQKFTPLMSTEFSHFGFVSPIKGGSSLVHESSGNLLFCTRKEEKILPAPYVKDLVDERVEELEQTQPFSATKKQRAEIKDDVELELLPRAFTRKVDVYAYINAENNTIIIDTASRTKAEDVLSLLRKAIGTLPVKGIETKVEPSEVMTSWVSGLFDFNSAAHTLGSRFTFGSEAHFAGIGDDSATAVVRNQDMGGEEVEVHLNAEQYITKLGLEYSNTMSFMLHDDLSIKRIRFEGIFEDSYNDDTEKFDGEFLLMAGELNNMIVDLYAEFDASATDSWEW
jgi:recombination associated protein RdgC